jgi:hypothetical protein
MLDLIGLGAISSVEGVPWPPASSPAGSFCLLFSLLDNSASTWWAGYRSCFKSRIDSSGHKLGRDLRKLKPLPKEEGCHCCRVAARYQGVESAHPCQIRGLRTRLFLLEIELHSAEGYVRSEQICH